MTKSACPTEAWLPRLATKRPFDSFHLHWMKYVTLFCYDFETLYLNSSPGICFRASHATKGGQEFLRNSHPNEPFGLSPSTLETHRDSGGSRRSAIGGNRRRGGAERTQDGTASAGIQHSDCLSKTVQNRVGSSLLGLRSARKSTADEKHTKHCSGGPSIVRSTCRFQKEVLQQVVRVLGVGYDGRSTRQRG